MAIAQIKENFGTAIKISLNVQIYRKVVKLSNEHNIASTNLT